MTRNEADLKLGTIVCDKDTRGGVGVCTLEQIIPFVTVPFAVSHGQPGSFVPVPLAGTGAIVPEYVALDEYESPRHAVPPPYPVYNQLKAK